MELAGVVRYTHYSLMVYGYQRIPIVEWLHGKVDQPPLSGTLLSGPGGIGSQSGGRTGYCAGG